VTGRRIARLAVTAGLLCFPTPVVAQGIPSDLAEERARFAQWLLSDPFSPAHAVARREIGAGLRLGPPTADIPLAGVAEHRVAERNGRVTLSGPEGERVLPRARGASLAGFALQADGSPGRTVLTVFRRGSGRKPAFYPYDPGMVFEGTLAPPERAVRRRVLGPDGVETDAVDAGTVSVPLGGDNIRLRVLRVLAPGTDESELAIFFRDGSNGAGTYPAGRFVELVPVAPGRYRLDFNRAHNPYCAYNTAYPCPAPWNGNTIPVAVHAGERYLGGGLAAPRPTSEAR
jgi:hypothetical protein